MVRTPWGNASELRERKLRPGSGTPREEVERNQRERLYGAMVAVAAEKGYEATTVADLLRISGVSRSDFYELFGSKEGCLVATVEALVGPTIATIARAKAPAGEERVREVFESFMRLAVRQAAASRVCFVEVYAAGSAAERAVERAFDAFETLTLETFIQTPGRAEMPAVIVRSILGGLRKIIHTRLYRHEDEDLLRLAPEIWEWGLSYYPPPSPLRTPRREPAAGPQFGGYTVPQRIARAVASVVAEKGYVAMGTGDIAGRASISLSTFYAHYANKEEAMLAAVELSGTLMLATVGPAVRRAPDWRAGVRAVYETMCAFLAGEPDFARLAVTEVYAAGPRALAQRDRVIDSLLEMLQPGYAENPGTPPVAAEAIGGAIYALLSDQLRCGGPDVLPEVAPMATYLTLTPFVGPEVACAVANGVA